MRSSERPSCVRYRRLIEVGLVLICALSTGLDGRTADGILRYVLSEGVIEGASPNDARAASLSWAQGIAESIGLFRGADAVVLSTPGEVVVAVNRGEADVAALSTLEYLSVEKRLQAKPALVWELAGSTMVEFVFLGRAGGATFAEASGKVMALHAPNRPWALSETWADVTLADAGVPGRAQAFSSVLVSNKRGHPTMAVFFGRADFAVDTRTAYETAVEMNPQVGRQVKVLATSPPLLPGLVCLSDRMSPELQARYVDKAQHLHEAVRYRQTFMVLRVNKLAAYVPASLDTVRALVDRQRRLQIRRQP